MDMNVIEEVVEMESVDPQLQHAIQQQHLMLEQQRHEELMRIQQNVVEQQKYDMGHVRPDDAMFRLQQEALRQNMSAMPPASMQPPGTGDDIMPPGIDSAPRDNFGRSPMISPPPLLRTQPPPLLGHTDMGGRKAEVEEAGKLPSLMSLKVDPPPPAEAAEVKLPMALEQALAFKSERAKQVGVAAGAEQTLEPLEDAAPHSAAPAEEDDAAPTRQAGRQDQGKNKQRKKKKKKRAKNRQPAAAVAGGRKDEDEETGEEVKAEIEYVTENLGFNDLEPMYRQFAKIFEAFRIAEPEAEVKEEKVEPVKMLDLKKVPKPHDDYEDEEDEEKKEESDKPKLSKRKLKQLTRLSVAELKQLVQRPDVVEMHDVTAKDPKLLVQLKAHRNTVPVPRHWCFKRKYLQGKRGIEKAPFDLPDFIKKTGIMEMRAALQEKEDQRTLKAKMRERARPKLGKIDIDYQKLHDAFFKWQTKPRMSIHGDLYYEGKEFETRLKEKKPGDLSEDLRTALGMPVGPSAHKVPPPWLIAMQRYGPPPSYPNLKIPGLNAAIPEGCSFGYHAGGWGKPPVDETGRPLYGDVFGITGQNAQSVPEEEEVDRTAWGELESESEEESEEEEEEEEEGAAGEPDETGLVTPAEGLITPSGITSMPAGMETPEIIELRKRKIESEMEGGETPVLYQVLPEKRMDRLGNAMMASTHIYDMTGGGGPQLPSAQLAPPRRGPGEGTVELALDPSELDLDNEAMAVRYEQQMREQQSNLQKEDLSDMLADHVARQKNKRKQRQQHQDSKQAKKYKEFKF